MSVVIIRTPNAYFIIGSKTFLSDFIASMFEKQSKMSPIFKRLFLIFCAYSPCQRTSDDIAKLPIRFKDISKNCSSFYSDFPIILRYAKLFSNFPSNASWKVQRNIIRNSTINFAKVTNCHFWTVLVWIGGFIIIWST